MVCARRARTDACSLKADGLRPEPHCATSIETVLAQNTSSYFLTRILSCGRAGKPEAAPRQGAAAALDAWAASVRQQYQFSMLGT
jgi:hypothetical protein